MCLLSERKGTADSAAGSGHVVVMLLAPARSVAWLWQWRVSFLKIMPSSVAVEWLCTYMCFPSSVWLCDPCSVLAEPSLKWMWDVVWGAITNCFSQTCLLSVLDFTMRPMLQKKDAENNLSIENCTCCPFRYWFHRQQPCLSCAVLLLSMKQEVAKERWEAVAVQRVAFGRCCFEVGAWLAWHIKQGEKLLEALWEGQPHAARWGSAGKADSFGMQK